MADIALSQGERNHTQQSGLNVSLQPTPLSEEKKPLTEQENYAQLMRFGKVLTGCHPYAGATWTKEIDQVQIIIALGQLLEREDRTQVQEEIDDRIVAIDLTKINSIIGKASALVRILSGNRDSANVGINFPSMVKFLGERRKEIFEARNIPTAQPAKPVHNLERKTAPRDDLGPNAQRMHNIIRQEKERRSSQNTVLRKNPELLDDIEQLVLLYGRWEESADEIEKHPEGKRLLETAHAYIRYAAYMSRQMTINDVVHFYVAFCSSIEQNPVKKHFVSIRAKVLGGRAHREFQKQYDAFIDSVTPTEED